ncbi:30S ribosomal protein S3 [candidate division MSBL1 archaeon SCGC-AAA259O05]|uniref:Small ribosomal subunit protein uS3 n=1 Tax=candidate division MSBL1 archaeon SCGC-AAA259O05 TaxID=1698271 RepID=A0A133V3M1_9EURY|nr:30S ribosomal protein S3 [candidate division MSBL1 archaeon SCGC-AAA259O05]
MSIEERFIEKSLDRARLEEFLEEELEEAGYGGVDIRKTPMGTRVTLFVERPGVVIGRGGRNVQALTDKLSEEFDLDDPQIEVSEIEVPEFNASIMANRVAFLLSRGVYYRRAGYGTLRRIMDAGARGAEIVTSGKLTGDFAREERFYDGYLKKAGKSASELVSTGQAVAELPAGTVGVKVRIMPPDVQLPDEIEVKEREEIVEEEEGVEEERPEEAL